MFKFGVTTKLSSGTIDVFVSPDTLLYKLNIRKKDWYYSYSFIESENCFYIVPLENIFELFDKFEQRIVPMIKAKSYNIVPGGDGKYITHLCTNDEYEGIIFFKGQKIISRKLGYTGPEPVIGVKSTKLTAILRGELTILSRNDSLHTHDIEISIDFIMPKCNRIETNTNYKKDKAIYKSKFIVHMFRISK